MNTAHRKLAIFLFGIIVLLIGHTLDGQATPLEFSTRNSPAPFPDWSNDSTVFPDTNPDPVLVPGQLAEDPGACMTSEEARLLELVNEYRTQNELSAVPATRALGSTGQWHVYDLETYHPDSGEDPRGLPCNLHSWSDQGYWSAVCYTSDHYYASGVWVKPNEISHGVYPGNGYELAYWTSGTATAEGALNAWKNSSGHNNMILEKEGWSGMNFPAMGAGISDHYTVLWFGDRVDPEGEFKTCGSFSTFLPMVVR